MDLPQYIQKLNPSAALMSDRAPNASITGIAELSKTLSGFLDGVNEYRDELNLDKARKEYELWLTQEKERFAQNTTIDNLETESRAFNQNATAKIDEVLQNNGIPWTKMQKASNKMQLAYCPSNLNYSIKIGEKIKLKAFETDETKYFNDMGNAISSASSAQLTGADGHAFLTNALDEAEASVDRAISSKYLPAYARDYAITKKKMEVTSMFFGRLLKENPQAAYDFVTHNSKQVLVKQAELFEKQAHTPTYQKYYSKSQEGYKTYQRELATLTQQERQQLGVKNVYVNKELSTNSYMYNLGALFDDARAQGIAFAEAVKDPNMLAKYATPYSPYFSTSSIYYNSDTADFAGHWREGQYIPASLTKTSAYYDKTLGFLNPVTIKAVQDGYATYESANRKEQQAARTNEAEKLYQLNKQLQADNIVGDNPTNVVYTTQKNKKNTASDPYKDVPMPTTFLGTKEIKELIKQEAKSQGVPLDAAMALFERESGFNPKARGADGEYSLGQLMPTTAQALGVTNPWDSLQNIRASLKYYKQALNKAGGDPVVAYAGYNGGLRSIEIYKNKRGSKQLNNNVNGFNKIYLRYKNGNRAK